MAICADAGRSGIYRGADFASVEREQIKPEVKQHERKLLIATDAACAGLNLQTLGTLTNFDLPWNPSRLEQRMDEYMHLRASARDAFEIRHQETIDPDRDRWKLRAEVPSRRDVVDRLTQPW